MLLLETVLEWLTTNTSLWLEVNETEFEYFSKVEAALAFTFCFIFRAILD